MLQTFAHKHRLLSVAVLLLFCLGLEALPALAEMGMLRISTTPGDAQIFINGKRKGSSPSEAGQTFAIKLSEGEYVVEAIIPVDDLQDKYGKKSIFLADDAMQPLSIVLEDHLTAKGIQAQAERKVKEEKEQVEQKTKKAKKQAERKSRYIANNDGTVTDKQTGLMWAAEDNGADINWPDAQAYCQNFKAGGHTDWRLPTQDELAGLYDKEESNECHHTPSIKMSTCYPWASETRSGSEAAGFNFFLGTRHWNDQSTSTLTRALPVRSGK